MILKKHVIASATNLVLSKNIYEIAYLIGITEYQSWKGPPVQAPLFTNGKTEAHRGENDLTMVVQ